MSQGIEYLRHTYTQLRNNAYNNQMKKVTYKDLGKMKQDAQKQIGNMQRANNFENLQEADYYRDKFTQVQSAMLNASKTKMSMKDYTAQVQQIMKDKGFTERNSYLNQAPVNPGTTSQPPPTSNAALKSFFEQKMLKVVPQVGFKSLLQKPPVSPRSFKKRQVDNQNQIQRLRLQNIQLRRKLQSSRSGVSAQNIQMQIKRQENRIKFLEEQNQRISKENTRLASQRNAPTTVHSNYSYDDYLYSPYVIMPRENDLGKISMRGSDIDSLSNYNRVVHYQNNQMIENNPPSFNLKSNEGFNDRNFDVMSQMDRNRSRYSVFDMSRSHYSELGLNDSRQQNSFNQSSRLQQLKSATRNKVAFFKPSGIIHRDEQVEIAYKRSESENLTGNRIILYFNNKTGQSKNITVYYEYESNYYDLNVTQSIGILDGFKQGRQVIEVRLKSDRQDINSLIEMNIQINVKRYRLWLPTMFMKFSQPKLNMQQGIDLNRKTIIASKLFANQSETQKVISSLQITGPGQAQLWGTSPVHQGPIKLFWKQANKLQVLTSSKWIDIITFLMFDYR